MRFLIKCRRASVGHELARYTLGVRAQGDHIISRLLLFAIALSIPLHVWGVNPHPYVDGEVLVKLKDPDTNSSKVSSKVTQSFFAKVLQKHSLRAKSSWSGLGLHHMKLDPGSTKKVDELVADLKTMPEVDYVEPNYIVQKAAVDPGGPSTQAYSLSQVLSFVGGAYGMTGAAIQAVPTWPILTASSNSSIVAVIDTGVDLAHPSLAAAIWTNPGEVAGNGIDDDHNGYVDDVHGWNFAYNNNSPQDDEGHGTHVSGIVLGVGVNIFSPPPATAHVKIMPVKFLDSNGSGTTANAINAIYYAVNNGASVLNNSWGGGDYSQALAQAITYAYNRDVLFVAAAGNSANNNDASPSYPASYPVPNVVAVAATDDSDVMAYFSNYGANSVALSSPGVSILSTWPGGLYAYLSGTSMAAPFSAGTAGLMRYQAPAMNCYQIKQLLLGNVDKKANLTGYVQTAGRVNVLNSVTAATNTPVDPYKPVFVLGANPADRNLAGAIAGRGGGCGLVAIVGKDFWDNTKDPKNRLRQVIVILALLLIPVMMLSVLRTPESRSTRRRHDRFMLNSSMTLKIGEQELVGAVRTISLGGSEIRTDALLKDGSTINMTITSPDGQSQIDVQGHVVWSESQKRYGVAFDNASEAVKTQIAQWSKALVKIS